MRSTGASPREVVQLPALGVLPSPEAYALDDAKGEKQHSFRLSQALAAARRTPLLGGREVRAFWRCWRFCVLYTRAHRAGSRIRVFYDVHLYQGCFH